MRIDRQTLINLCDDFFNDKIEKVGIQVFTWNAINDDQTTWEEDEIISQIIFEWDNEDINFEIDRPNIQLWRTRLLAGFRFLADKQNYVDFWFDAKLKHK